MIAMSLKVVGMLALSEKLSWQMIDSNGIITYLEDGGVLLPLSLSWMKWILLEMNGFVHFRVHVFSAVYDTIM